MIRPDTNKCVYLCLEPLDMCKQVDGLSEVVPKFRTRR